MLAMKHRNWWQWQSGEKKWKQQALSSAVLSSALYPLMVLRLPGFPRTVCTVRLSILTRKTQIARVSFAGFFYVYVCGMHLPMFTYRWEWAPVCVYVCMPLCVCVCCVSHRLMAGFFLISSTLYLLRRRLPSQVAQGTPCVHLWGCRLTE